MLCAWGPHLIRVRDGRRMNTPGAMLLPGRGHPAEEIHRQTVTGILMADCENCVGSRKRQRQTSGKFREVASDLVWKEGWGLPSRGWGVRKLFSAETSRYCPGMSMRCLSRVH